MIPLLVLLLVQNPGTDVQAVYLRGWDAAQRRPGSAVHPSRWRRCGTRSRPRADGGRRHGPAEIATYVLRAAADAAQDERDEMALFLAHAVELERVQLDAGSPARRASPPTRPPAICGCESGATTTRGARTKHARSVIGSTPLIETGLARANDAFRR